MTRLSVIGGTGYAGSAVVREASARGHEVISFSRAAPERQVAGVRYETGDALERPDLARGMGEADAVVVAVAPRGPMAGRVIGMVRQAAELAGAHGTRLGVVGGFSTLRPAADAARFVDGDLPDHLAGEAREMAGVLAMLRDEADAVDWFYVCPAAGFGAGSPGVRTGHYRLGGEVALRDEQGRSEISAEDFAAAVVDEIERPAHHREVFSVAY